MLVLTANTIVRTDAKSRRATENETARHLMAPRRL
jgi:hypothetical protein